MNINDKVPELSTNAGLKTIRERTNQIIRYQNWLLSMRTTEGTISGGGRGPVINNSPSSIDAGAQPWLTDPDGNAAGWVKMTMMNLTTGNLYDAWVWAGPSSNLRPIPWWTDTSGNPAGWLIGGPGQLWGTGNYPPGAAVPYQQVKFTYPGNYSSPVIFNGVATNPPIVPPASPPVLFIKQSPYLGNVTSTPVAGIWMPSIGGPAPALTVNFTWQITYDGTVIYTASGSGNFTNPKIYLPLSTTGWQFDPTGLSGYTKGENSWIYLYSGTISSNTNPPVVQTFTYTTSNNATVQPDPFGVTLYTS